MTYSGGIKDLKCCCECMSALHYDAPNSQQKPAGQGWVEVGNVTVARGVHCVCMGG